MRKESLKIARAFAAGLAFATAASAASLARLPVGGPAAVVKVAVILYRRARQV